MSDTAAPEGKSGVLALFLEVGGWLFAAPLGLGALTTFTDKFAVGDILERAVLGYQQVSRGFWTGIIGERAYLPDPTAHLLLSFFSLVYLPAFTYLIWHLVRAAAWQKPLPDLHGGSGFAWYLVSAFGAFGLYWAFVPNLVLTLYILVTIGLVMLAGYILVKSSTPEGKAQIQKRFAFPTFKRKWQEDLWLAAFALILLHSAWTQWEFVGPVTQRTWIVSIATAPMFFMLMAAIRFGLRYPGKIFLAASGIYFANWVEVAAAPWVRAWLASQGV